MHQRDDRPARDPAREDAFISDLTDEGDARPGFLHRPSIATCAREQESRIARPAAETRARSQARLKEKRRMREPERASKRAPQSPHSESRSAIARRRAPLQLTAARSRRTSTTMAANRDFLAPWRRHWEGSWRKGRLCPVPMGLCADRGHIRLRPYGVLVSEDFRCG